LSNEKKTINTLVPDILELLAKGSFKIDGTKLGELIERRLSEERTPKLSMSNFGKPCDRQLWLQINRPDLAAPLDGATRLKFLYGDILEEIILSLAEQAGHDVKGRQDDCSYGGLIGHRDAIIDGMVIDVKSANSRSFEKFRTHSVDREDGDNFGYIDQLSLYVLAGADDPEVEIKGEGAFLAIDKEQGRMVLDKYPRRRITDKDIEEKRRMLAQPEPPECHYELGPRGGKPWQCSYCSHKEYCRSEIPPKKVQ